MKKNGVYGPHSELPTNFFVRNNVSAPPVNTLSPVATGTTFILQLFNNKLEIGYLGLNSDNYCVLVAEPTNALTLTLYNYEGVNYYTANGSYLTVNEQTYVCLEDWYNASGWTFEPNGTFSCSYNSQHLSLYSDNNGFLYSYDQYTVLLVKQVTPSNQ